MSINLETGLWRCFKSGEAGNFYKLLSHLEGWSYAKSMEEATYGSYLLDPEEKKKKIRKQIENKPVNFNDFLNIDCINIKLLPEERRKLRWDPHSEIYDNLKKLTTKKNLLHLNWPFYLCWPRLEAFRDLDPPIFPKLTGRLIIPYMYGESCVWFQARALLDSQQPKYLNSPGSKASQILMPYYENYDHLFVTEGPLDAIVLKNWGFNATCVNGSYISRNQALALKQFAGNIVLSFDNDEAGAKGVMAFEKLRKKLMMPVFFTVTPPSSFKDWGEMFASDPEGNPPRIFDMLEPYDWGKQMMLKLSGKTEEELL